MASSILLMMLWLSVSIILKKAALDTQKGASLGLKCVRMRLAAGLRPDSLGKLERSPRPRSRDWGRLPTSKGEERAGNGKREGREWQGPERERKEGMGGPPSRIAKVQRWQP